MATFSYLSPNIGDSDYPTTIDTFINQIGIDLTGFSDELDSISLYINESLTDYVLGNIDHTLKKNKSFYWGDNNDFRIRNTGSSGTHMSHTGAGHLFITSGTSTLTMLKNGAVNINSVLEVVNANPSIHIKNTDSNNISTLIFIDSSGSARGYVYKVNSAANGSPLVIDSRAAGQAPLSQIALTETGFVTIVGNGGITLNGNVTVINGNIGTPYISSSGGADFGSSVAINGGSSNLAVGGNLTVNGTISGGISFTNLILPGTLTVGGTTTLNGTTNTKNVGVTGTLTTTSSITVGGNLTTNGGGTSTIGNNFTVQGFTSLNANASIVGTLTVGGLTTINDNVVINGNLTVSGTVNGGTPGGGDPETDPTYNTLSVTNGTSLNFVNVSDSVNTGIVWDLSRITMEVNTTDVIYIDDDGVTFNEPAAFINNNDGYAAAFLGNLSSGTGIYSQSGGGSGDAIEALSTGGGAGIFTRATGTGRGVDAEATGDYAIVAQCRSNNNAFAGLYASGKYLGIVSTLVDTISDSNPSYAIYSTNQRSATSAGNNFGIYTEASGIGLHVVIPNSAQSYDSFGVQAVNLAAGSGTSYGILGLGSDWDFYAAGTGLYGPFTGSHDSLVTKGYVVTVGDIAVDYDYVGEKEYSDTLFSSQLSSISNQSNVLGVYSNSSKVMVSDQTRPAALQNLTDVQYLTIINNYNRCSVNSVGEGSINVCGQNGDVVAGDLIVSSDIEGKGMKQSDNIVRSHTVARARQDMSFSSATEVKKIACIYLCG